MTEAEVLETLAALGVDTSKDVGNVMLGEGDDREMWSVFNGRAHMMWPSARQQRLERAPLQWEVDAIKSRGSRTETVYDGSPEMPDELVGAIAWLQGQLDSIPAEHRGTARISFDERREYGESYANICITYERPETDDEWEARKADLEERLAYHRELRRKEFEALRSEFEDAHYAHPGVNG